jgi:hypothetical protein
VNIFGFMVKEDLEALLRITGEEPYHTPDYSIKRRKLTKRLKNIFAIYFGKNSSLIINLFTSRKGFTPSDQLLKYSFRKFEDVLNAIIATCDSVVKLDEYKERELKRNILKAVIEIKTDQLDLK